MTWKPIRNRNPSDLGRTPRRAKQKQGTANSFARTVIGFGNQDQRFGIYEALLGVPALAGPTSTLKRGHRAPLQSSNDNEQFERYKRRGVQVHIASINECANQNLG